MPLEGLDKLRDLLRKIALVKTYYKNMEGEEIRAGETKGVLFGGPVLWQDTNESSGDEKAEFERNNKELVDRLRLADQDTKRILRGK